MGILPDNRLHELGPTLLDPFNPAMVQPASIDVTIDCYFYKVQTRDIRLVVDPSIDNTVCFDDMIEVSQDETFTFKPGDFVLASTFERVTVPNNLVARFEGKSSLGRLGLMAHVTAGFIDPGFSGHITLELKNVTSLEWLIKPGMKIGQICFEELSQPVTYPYGDPVYGSHYQDQRGPTLSRAFEGFSTTNVYYREEVNAWQEPTTLF